MIKRDTSAKIAEIQKHSFLLPSLYLLSFKKYLSGISKHTELVSGRPSDCTTLELPHPTEMYGQQWAVTSRRVRVWHFGHCTEPIRKISFKTMNAKARFQEVKQQWPLPSCRVCSCCPISLLSYASFQSFFKCIQILHGLKRNALYSVFSTY